MRSSRTFRTPRAFAARGSLFGGFDAGGGISIDIQSADPEATRAAAKLGFKLLTKKLPDGLDQSATVARLRPARIPPLAQ